MSTLIDAFAAALVHFLWQGCILGAAVAACFSWLRRCTAATRYAILFGALLSAPFVFSINIAVRLASPPVLWASEPLVLPDPNVWSHGPPLLVVAWLCGVSGLASATALQWRQLVRLRAHALPLRAWQARMRPFAHRLGFTRRFTIAETPAVLSPVVIGWWRPIILVPLGFVTSMPPAWVEAILVHEIAHLRRYDFLCGLVQRTIEIVLFFHPVIWWISSQVRHARESACDDLVVDALQDPVAYGHALSTLARSPSSVPGLTMAASQGSLMKRIEHIVTYVPRSLSPLPAAALRGTTLAFSVAALVGVAFACATNDLEAEASPASAVIGSSSPEASISGVEQDDSAIALPWLPESVRQHAAEIRAAATAHGVDPELLAIMVFAESRGNAQARSPIGARGLMQIMPETADGIAGERGIVDHSPDRLDDASYNLDLGAWYLAQQLERFGVTGDARESVGLAVAAYNAGPDHLESVLAGEAELSAETIRYRTLVTDLWDRRSSHASAL